MLKFIQMLLEKHRKIVFGILLFVIIVPFVFTIGNMPGIGHSKRKAKQSSFLGYDLSDQKVVEQLLRESSLSLSLQREQPDAGSIQSYTLTRLLFLNYAKSLKMPSPTDEQFQKFLQTKPLFWNGEKVFDPEIYNDYLVKWKSQLGGTQMLRKVLEEDFKCEAVQEFLSAPGFVLPQEVEWLFKRFQTAYRVQWVEFPIKDFNPTIEAKSEDLLAFYEKNKKSYRVSKRAEVTLLQFDNKNYQTKLSVPGEEDLKAYFEANKNIFEKHNENVPSFDALKEEIKKSWTESRLSQLAEKSVNDFSFEVYDKNIRPDTPEWTELLKRYAVKTVVMKPYTRDEIPTLKEGSADLLGQAFNLDKDHYITEPSKTQTSWQLLCLKQLYPAYVPEFKEVKTKVEEDYIKQKRNEAFLAHVTEIQKNIAKPEQSFEAFATQQGLKFNSLEPLTLERLFLQLGEKIGIVAIFDVIKQLELLNENQFLNPRPSENGVILLKLVEKKAPVLDQKSDEFMKFSDEYQQRAQARQAEGAISEAIERALPSST